MQISEVKKILEEILHKLSIDVKRVEVVASDPHTFLSISTPDSGILIGVQGENLRALNYLIKKIVEAKSSSQDQFPSFIVDVNGYHRRRVAELRQRAHVLAERARTFKSDIAMDPLNSYERMIVHAALVDDLEVRTESAGIGKERHIVFKYENSEESTSTSDKELFAQEKVE